MRNGESGNVFVYIMLAVALLAGLSFAVSQGGRVTSTQLTQDTRNLIATEIISYSDTVAKAVTQLRLRGTQITELSFANEFLSSGSYGNYNTDPSNEIFNPSGGAVIYQRPPASATTTGTEEWNFLSNNEIEQVGTTCGAASCSDIVMALFNVSVSVCTEINNLLSVPNPSNAPPQDSDIEEDDTFEPGASPFGYDETVGDETDEMVGKDEACFEETSDGEYVYYKVLLPR